MYYVKILKIPKSIPMLGIELKYYANIFSVSHLLQETRKERVVIDYKTR